MPQDSQSGTLLVQLSDLLRARKTGRLVLARRQQRLVIDVREGQITGVEAERVLQPGEEADPEEPLVLEMDLSPDPGLVRAAARQRLLEAITWADASCVFSEGALGGGNDPPLALSTAEVLSEALPLVRDPLLIRAALGDLDRVLSVAFDPLQPRSLTLTPTEGYLLSRIDGILSAREVLQLIPLDPAETERSLLRLLLAGLVEYLALPGRPAVPVADLAPPLELDLGLEKDEPAAPTLPQPPPRPVAASVLSPAQLAAERAEIETAYKAKVANRNHFEVLDLDRSADAPAVKSAYFRLAKRFHPDAHRDPGVDDLKENLKAVFVRLGSAYEVLSNTRKRADYESSLPRRSFTPPRAGPAASPSAGRGPSTSGWSPPDPGPAPSEEDLAQRDLQVLSRAEEFMTEGKYWDAIQTLEAALGSFVGRRRNKAQLVLARAYAKNPKWLRRAEEFAQAVVKEEPANADAYFILAGIYKAGHLENRATGMYRKVLELRPDHAEAREALGVVDTPAKPASTPLLKRLFRKS